MFMALFQVPRTMKGWEDIQRNFAHFFIYTLKLTVNDEIVFWLSSLNTTMGSNEMNWPHNYIIVWDDAFPLQSNLLKPFFQIKLNIARIIFNYCTLCTRRVVENDFEIFAWKFQVFGKSVNLKLTTVDIIVQ